MLMFILLTDAEKMADEVGSEFLLDVQTTLFWADRKRERTFIDLH